MVASFIRRISFENGDISESILGEMRLCSRAMKWFSDRLLGWKEFCRTYVFPANRDKMKSRRADSNRLPLLQLRVIGQALQGFAEACKCRISRRLSLLRFAACCTVLRSRWYQIGIRTSGSYSLTVGPMSRTPDLRSHNPPTPVSGRCPTLQNRLR